MGTYVPVFSHLSDFLHLFVMAKLAPSSTRVSPPQGCAVVCLGVSAMFRDVSVLAVQSRLPRGSDLSVQRKSVK